MVLPRQNENDVTEATGLDLVFVDEMSQVLSHLVLPQHSLPADSVQQRKILLLNTYCVTKGWQLSAVSEIQKWRAIHCHAPNSRGPHYHYLCDWCPST